MPVAWKLTLDGKPWPDGLVYTGPFGLAAQTAKQGILGDEARYEVYSPELPEIDPGRDLGMFITRDKRGESLQAGPAGNEGAAEMNKMLQDWGYAHGGGKK
jgi:hypothetical protein